MILFELADPVRQRHWATQALRYDYGAFPDKWAPCRHACMCCHDCKTAIRFMCVMLDKSTVYEVVDKEDLPVGVIWFTDDDVMHGYFQDHQLVGRASVFEQAANLHEAKTGNRVQVKVPKTSEVIARWLDGNGFTWTTTVNNRDFWKYGEPQDVHILELEK